MNKKGCTLVEVVIATLIISIFFGIFSGGIISISNNKKRTEQLFHAKTHMENLSEIFKNSDNTVDFYVKLRKAYLSETIAEDTEDKLCYLDMNYNMVSIVNDTNTSIPQNAVYSIKIRKTQDYRISATFFQCSNQKEILAFSFSARNWKE